MDEIIDYYINKLLENSMIDNSIAIYLYENYLMNDNRYIKHLSQEIKYLIVDSLESCSNAEVDFINLLSSYTLDTYLYFNKTKGFMFEEIAKLKSLIRKMFKAKIRDYAYDNIFHLTVDNDEYEFTEEVCRKYVKEYRGNSDEQ